MIGKLGFELYKNFKIIFRNLSSVSLLILGPLFLILLIGFAFSGTSVHSIVIGVKASDYDSLSPYLSNFTGIGEVRRYEMTEACIDDMRLELSHICLEFSDGFGKAQDDGEMSQGHVAFYYDNTRKQLSSEIVNKISEFMGVTSQKISLDSAQTIFENIEGLVIFLNSRNDDLLILINESETIKRDIILRKERLIDLREDFLPRYREIKMLQSAIHNSSSGVDRELGAFNRSLERFEDSLEETRRQTDRMISDIDVPAYYAYVNGTARGVTSNLTYLRENGLSYVDLSNLTDFNVTGLSLVTTPDFRNMTSIDLTGLPSEDVLNIMLLSLKKDLQRISLEGLRGEMSDYHRSIDSQVEEFDEAVYQIDMVKLMIDEEIKASDTYVAKIEEGVGRIREIRQSLDQNLDRLEKLNPSLAEKLIKPILQSFEPLDAKASNIKMSFPTLLTLVIVFISVLFSNIVTLAELNSKAYLRNLIAPVDDLIYLLGLVLTNLSVILFQVFVLLLVAQYRFAIDVFSVIGPISLIVLMLSLIFIFIGMGIAYVFRNEQTSILTATFLAIAFFMFSNMVAPLEAMPIAATRLAMNSPFVLGQSVFKKVILFDIPLAFSSLEILKLSAWLLLAFAVLVIAAKAMNRKRM